MDRRIKVCPSAIVRQTSVPAQIAVNLRVRCFVYIWLVRLMRLFWLKWLANLSNSFGCVKQLGCPACDSGFNQFPRSKNLTIDQNLNLALGNGQQTDHLKPLGQAEQGAFLRIIRHRHQNLFTELSLVKNRVLAGHPVHKTKDLESANLLLNQLLELNSLKVSLKNWPMDQGPFALQSPEL